MTRHPLTPPSTYRPDLSGVWAKIDRAREHTQALNLETGWLDDPNGNPVRSPVHRIPVKLEYEPDTGYHVFRATAPVPNEVARRWGLITGDAIHNLRGALDYLVWQLALVNCEGREPPLPKKVQFPITDEPMAPGTPRENFASKRGGPLWQVRPEHRAIIYEHQPHGSRHNFGHGPVHPFSRLRDLSNLDKHRLLIEPVVEANNFMIDTAGIFGAAGGKIVEEHIGADMGETPRRDAELMRVKVTPGSVRVNSEVAGFIYPEPEFWDTVPGDRMRYGRSVYIELMSITMQVVQLVREIEQVL